MTLEQGSDVKQVASQRSVPDGIVLEMEPKLAFCWFRHATYRIYTPVDRRHYSLGQREFNHVPPVEIFIAQVFQGCLCFCLVSLASAALKDKKLFRRQPPNIRHEVYPASRATKFLLGATH
jgi:hypothetical protein